MTDAGPLTVIDHVETEIGCCIGRNSKGEYEGIYYANPPSGDGWVEVSWVERNGGKKTLWRRFRLA